MSEPSHSELPHITCTDYFRNLNNDVMPISTKNLHTHFENHISVKPHMPSEDFRCLDTYKPPSHPTQIISPRRNDMKIRHNVNDSIGSNISSDFTVISSDSNTTLIDSPQLGGIPNSNETSPSKYEIYKLKSSSLVDVSFNPPKFVRHSTCPTIVTSKANDFTNEILKFNVKYLEQNELVDLMNNTKILPSIKLPNLLILDIRSFTDYVKSHLSNAINMCLPSTLLKRTNFSFIRCVNSLPLYEKLIMKHYFNYQESNKTNHSEPESSQIPCNKYGFPSILIYDNVNNSPNLYFMLKKIYEEFDDINIYVVKDSFPSLENGSLCEEMGIKNGKDHKFDIEELLGTDTNLCKQIPISSSPKSPDFNSRLQVKAGGMGTKLRSNSLNDLKLSPLESSTPILSNFKLPNPKMNFKIRHNEEVFSDEKIGINLITKYDLTNPQMVRKLPNWFQVENLKEDVMTGNFNHIEQDEKNRLNQCLTINNNGKLGEFTISSGIEMGHKNRYKDILLFDHTRVKLVDLSNPTQESQLDIKHPEDLPFDSLNLSRNDYINASYINSIANLNIKPSNPDTFKYIATQGPLKHTVGDFYKCIINNNVSLVIALTAEIENGMNKCEAYWQPGTFYSFHNKIQVEVLDTYEMHDHLIMRKIKLTYNETSRTILQVHLTNWLDNEICKGCDDLMRIIQLRSLLIDKLKLTGFSTLVHCSAGCGRTGTFITIDTMANLLLQLGKDNTQFESSTVERIVSNLRIQRISMVQNLRQFISIYEMLINYFTKSFETHDMKIIDSFIKEYKS